MSNEKQQIEEMARIIGHCESTLHPDIECHNKATGCYCIENPCRNQRIADKLYTAGYRKQSEGEWIKPTMYSEHICSNCGRSPKIFFGLLSPYCPNCGAKMFVRMTHTCPHNIPNLIPTIEELLKGGAE